jgi:hypothetical protein
VAALGSRTKDRARRKRAPFERRASWRRRSRNDEESRVIPLPYLEISGRQRDDGCSEGARLANDGRGAFFARRDDERVGCREPNERASAPDRADEAGVGKIALERRAFGSVADHDDTRSGNEPCRAKRDVRALGPNESPNDDE